MRARELLAASHAQMAPDEIAGHSLDLADLVETYFARIRSLEAALEDAHANAESLRNGWLNARSRVAEAERLRSQRRRREARAILVALAAPLELPALPNTIGRLADPDEAFAANG